MLFSLPFSRNVSCPKHLVYYDSDPDSDTVHGLSDDLESLSSLCSHFRSAFMSPCLCDHEEGEGFMVDREVLGVSVISGFLPFEGLLPEVPPTEPV